MSDPFGDFLVQYGEYLEGQRPYESLRIETVEHETRKALTVEIPEKPAPLPVARLLAPKR